MSKNHIFNSVLSKYINLNDYLIFVIIQYIFTDPIINIDLFNNIFLNIL